VAITVPAQDGCRRLLSSDVASKRRARSSSALRALLRGLPAATRRSRAARAAEFEEDSRV